MDPTPKDRVPRSLHAFFELLAALLLVMSSFAGSASAAPSPAASPCQPWGDETTEGADLWAEVGARVPTFAGLYVDEDIRTLYVLLTDQGQSLEAAVHVLQTIVRSSELCEFTPVAVPAKYSYLQLKEWNDRMGPLWSIEGLVFDGIDEMHNRIDVGVEDLAKQGPLVEAKLVDLGIPREVVNIVQHEPVELLIERRRPWALIGSGIGLVSAVVVSGVVVARRRNRHSQRREAL